MNHDTMTNDSLVNPGYKACIDACLQCIDACNECASACMREKDVEHLALCIQMDLECVAICKAAADLMTLGSNHANALCQVCADICNACAAECEKHEHAHCQQCAAACRRCVDECAQMIAA